MKNESLSRSSIRQTCLVLIILLMLFGLYDANNYNCVKTPTRPFYLIGHMCNSIDDVKKFVSSGANSIEIDIQFTEDGLLDTVYHGIPCDCLRYCYSREDIDPMFEYIKKISTPGDSDYQSHLTLVLFDLKIKWLSTNSKVTAGIMMADKLINILFESEQSLSKIRVVLGLELTSDYQFVYALVDRFNQRNFPALLDRIGFDVSGNEDIDNIEYLWKFMFENKLNVWQGDGITNCLSYARPTQRTRELIKKRENNKTESYTAKIYQWTIDMKWTIKDSLRLGVDGMITNEVQNILDALNDDEFKTMYHLATNDDDPFCVVRDAEMMTMQHNYNQLSKHKLINNLMITNYVMQGNDNEQSSGQTTSPTMKLKPFSSYSSSNNFENDNLIRTGNDFKRMSFSDFNFRQLISQLIGTLANRNRYEKYFRLALLERQSDNRAGRQLANQLATIGSDSLI